MTTQSSLTRLISIFGLLIAPLACSDERPTAPQHESETAQFAKGQGKGKGKVEAIELSAVFRDLGTDLLRSDAGISGWGGIIGSSEYVDGSRAEVRLMSSGNFRFDLDPDDCWKRKRCGGHRLYVVDLPDELLDLVDLPDDLANLRSGAHGYMTTSRPSLENGFRALQPGQKMATHLFAYSGRYWNGSKLVPLQDGYSLQYGGACGAESPHPEHRVLVTALDNDADGETDFWVIEAAAATIDAEGEGTVDLTGHALLCAGAPWEEVAEVDAPFRITLTKLGS